MMKRKIALLGAMGDGKATSSGQIIRTNIIKNSLEEEYGSDAIVLVNTSAISKKPWRFIAAFWKMVFSCRDIMIILSINGMKRLWPLFSFMAKVLKKRVYNNVIGGNLLVHMEKYPQFAKYMRNFTINWVQSKRMQKELETYQVFNTEWLPNAKPIRIIKEEEITHIQEPPFHFCTFSRVSKPKGIELAIHAIKSINEEHKKVIATLEIFGKPDDDYLEEFEALIETFPSYIHYGGVVPFSESVETLSRFFMLLFPTTFYGEGFPGTIIDAYASGTPVLASDWNCNPEVIADGVTGILYDHTKPEELREKIEWALSNVDQVDAMKKNCIVEAEKYTMEKVYRIVFNRIEAEGKKK